MNNIVIYCTHLDINIQHGFYTTLNTHVPTIKNLHLAERLTDMKTAIHKSEELNKAGYTTQLLMIL